MNTWITGETTKRFLTRTTDEQRTLTETYYKECYNELKL